MKIYELFESIWDDVINKWQSNGYATDDIKSTLAQFKTLRNANKLFSLEKDINYWSKKPFTEFQAFIDKKLPELNKTVGATDKKIKNAHNQIILDDTDEWLISIPLDKETSQNLGAGSNWCTSTKTEVNNKFNEYVYSDLTTLIYIIGKTSTEKYAIKFNDKNGELLELQNRTNNEISQKELLDSTGYNTKTLIAAAQKNTEWVAFYQNLFNISKEKEKEKQRIIKFVHAAQDGNLQYILNEIDLGISPHINNEELLRVSSLYGQVKIINFLLDEIPGTNVHAEDDQSLMFAIEHGHTEVVRILITHGANIHTNNDESLTMATKYGWYDICKLLLKNGNFKSESLNRALIMACKTGSCEANTNLYNIVQLLIKHGADVHCNGNAPAYYAKSFNKTILYDILDSKT